MTNINNNNLPKTETIYELKESDYEIKTSKLSLAARNKIINRWGSNYLSENKEMYGPGFWEDLAKGASGTLLAASYFTPAAIVTVPATVGVAAWGAAASAGGGDPEYGKAGEFALGVAASAAVNTVSTVATPAAGAKIGGGASKVIAKCSTHCPK
jgi:hypothetical protein